MPTIESLIEARDQAIQDMEDDIRLEFPAGVTMKEAKALYEAFRAQHGDRGLVTISGLPKDIMIAALCGFE